MVRTASLVMALLAGCLLLPGCGAGDGVRDVFEGPDTPPGASMTAAERALALDVLQRVNAERAAAELEPLAWDEAASDVAYDHAVDMRLRSFYAHMNPDGLSACDRMWAAQIDMDFCIGENIARNNPTPSDVMAAWMASDVHRTAILAPRATHIGIGVHTGRDGPWWVQEFYIRNAE